MPASEPASATRRAPARLGGPVRPTLPRLPTRDCGSDYPELPARGTQGMYRSATGGAARVTEIGALYAVRGTTEEAARAELAATYLTGSTACSATPVADPDPSAGGEGGGGGGTHLPAAGAVGGAGAGPDDAEPATGSAQQARRTPLFDTGCDCSIASAPRRHRGWALLLVGALVALRRRRHRSAAGFSAEVTREPARASRRSKH